MSSISDQFIWFGLCIKATNIPCKKLWIQCYWHQWHGSKKCHKKFTVIQY